MKHFTCSAFLLILGASLSWGQFNGSIITGFEGDNPDTISDISGIDPNGCGLSFQDINGICTCTDTATTSINFQGGNKMIARTSPSANTVQVVPSGDGTLVGLDNIGNTYTYTVTTDQWTTLPGNGASGVAVGRIGSIYKLSGTTNPNVYQLNIGVSPNTWVRFPAGLASKITAGADGSLLALYAGGVAKWTPTGLATGSWAALPAVPNGGAIDIAGPLYNGNPWAFVLDKTGNAWAMYNGISSWQSVTFGSGFNHLAIGSDYHMWLSKPNDNHLYGSQSVSLPAGTVITSMSAINGNILWFVDGNGKAQQVLASATTTKSKTVQAGQPLAFSVTSVATNMPLQTVIPITVTQVVNNSCLGQQYSNTGNFEYASWAAHTQAQKLSGAPRNLGTYLGVPYYGYPVRESCGNTSTPDFTFIQRASNLPAETIAHPTPTTSNQGWDVYDFCQGTFDRSNHQLYPGSILCEHPYVPPNPPIYVPTNPGTYTQNGSCTVTTTDQPWIT